MTPLNSFLFITFFAPFTDIFLFGQPPGCDQNSFVSHLASILHCMGVHYPILVHKENSTRARLDLNALKKMKCDWPTQPLDSDLLHFARDNGIPLLNGRNLDMKRIIAMRDIKELTESHGTLMCTLEPLRRQESYYELHEGQGSNSYSPTSFNNYENHHYFSDRECANEPLSPEKNDSELSRSYERIKPTFFDKEMRGVHERTASRRPRSSYEDQAHRESYEETENRRNRLVTYYDDDEESSINSSRRERQRYNDTPHQPEYEEIQQNSPITYDGRESERDALANYQPTDYDETQQNSARSQSQGRIRERPTHNQEEMPKQSKSRQAKEYGNPSDSARKSANRSTDHIRVRIRTNFNEDEPEKEERRHSKEYYYKNALEITDEETSNRKSDRQQRQSHSRSSSRYIYGQHEVPKRVKSKEPKKPSVTSEQFDHEGVQYYSGKPESQGHGKTRQKENAKRYKEKEAQREEAGSNASKDSVYFTGSDQSEEEMNSPNDLNESDLETVQQSSDESDRGSTTSSSIESDFETWLKKPVKQKHKLNVKAEKDKQALSLEDNKSRNRDVIDEDIQGRSSEDKQRHRFEGRPPPSPSRADNSQRAKRREQESANAAEEKHKAAKHWHDVSYPPSPKEAEEEEADQKRIPRFYSSEDIAAHPVIPLVECEHAIGQINVFVQLVYSFRMRTSRVLYKRNGKSNSKLLVFNMGELVVNDIEWARIERPLDDTQLAFAVQNYMHLKKRADGATTLDLEAFMMNPFFVRMIQDEKIRQILCRILFDERDDSTNNESRAEGRSTIQKINSSQKISDPHQSRAPKSGDKMKSRGQNESGESSKSGKKSGSESSKSLLKRRQSLAKNSENDPLQRDLAVRIIEPTNEWGGKENQYHDRNSSESSPISTTQEHLSLRSPNIGQRSPSIRSPMQALKISAQGQIVENDSAAAANEHNVSSSDHSKYDCQIAEQLLKHWLALKEPNRNKRIQMYLSQTFVDRNSNGRNLLKKMGTKNYKKISETIEKLERIVTEKPKNERLFLRKMSEQFDKFMTLMEQIMNEKSCNHLPASPIEEISPKSPRAERIEVYWDDEIMETKSQEKIGGEVSNEKPFQKISKQLINQLSKLKGRFEAKPKKGRGFIVLLEDIYFEVGSPGLRWKINKISEAMKWSGLREVSISLRQRKSAMVNAWRRVAWLCRVLVIMADLVERAEEAFAALDRLLEALKLLAVGTNLKEEFERLDGGGDTELNKEGGGGQAGQLANEEPFDFAAFVNVLDIFGMNQLSFRLANVSVKPSMVGEARILFRATRKAVADNKHEVHGGIWDPKQSRKFEMTEAISEFVKAKDSNGSMERLLGFLDEFNRSNRFDMVRKFADQVDIYRDDPREDVHELWRKFMEGIDWIHRLNCGRKLLQFIQLLHRLLPKYTEMNRLKAEDQREQLEEEMFWAEEEETVPTPAAEGAPRGDDEANSAKNRVLRAFATLELETIYKNIKEKMLAQFEGWWKRVPEQKEPLYEFFKQLEDISTRYVMAIVDAFFDGISIESFRQEYSLGVKVITVLKKEERIAADKLRHYELDPTQGIRIRERKKTYRENDLAIRNLVEGFGAIENPNDDEILAHLRSLQYRLMRNDFENWGDPNDVKVNKTKDQQRPIAENDRTIHPNQNVRSDTEQTANISANDKTPNGVIGETNAFFDHFSADQHILFDKESNRFNLSIFIQTFDKSLQITKFLTIGLASVFKWRKRFLSELAESAANELNEFDGFMYFFETGNSGSGGKKRKFRKPLPPVLSKQTLKTIVKVIRVYEMKFRHNNISQMSDQKILDVHWRKVREAQEKAKIAKRKTAEDEQSSSSASLSRTSSNEAVGEQWLRMLSMEGDEVPMDERERKESLDKIEALVKAKRLLLFAIILRQKYARIERKNAKIAAEVVVNFEPIDAAYFELLRDIRRETERWVPRQREIKRLYRVCRNLNRAERVEIGKLVDAFLRGQSVDNYLESQTTKRDKKRGEKAP